MEPSLIRKLSDRDLIDQLRTSVQEERRQTALVLEFLREVDRRRLYADFGHPSLWEFCLKELSYSEAAASRRIASMRLLREIPELKEDLVEGKQTLSTLAQAQKFFRIEEKTLGTKLSALQKKEVLTELQGKSSRECEKKLLSLSSAPLEIQKPERERTLDESHTELRLVIDAELQSKLKKTQALRSHADPSLSYVKLLNFMADEILKRLDPELKPSRSSHQPPTSEVMPSSQAQKSAVIPPSPPPTSEVIRRRTPVPITTRREIWKRDRGHCAWKDPQTGKTCRSTYFLEIDHLRPVALGGSNEIANLQLKCRAHNQRAAIQILGGLSLAPRPSSE